MRSPRTQLIILFAELLADRALTFGHISQTGVIQNIGDGIAHIAH
jgi:hypothetical protein